MHTAHGLSTMPWVSLGLVTTVAWHNFKLHLALSNRHTHTHTHLHARGVQTAEGRKQGSKIATIANCFKHSGCHYETDSALAMLHMDQCFIDMHMHAHNATCVHTHQHTHTLTHATLYAARILMHMGVGSRMDTHTPKPTTPQTRHKGTPTRIHVQGKCMNKHAHARASS
jgi:hypothetical protein